MEQKQHNLLVYLLEVISEACDTVESVCNTNTNDLYTPKFWDAPIFEFDDEDIEAIKSLSEYEPRLQELLEMIEETKR
jgi:hypothetical protein